MKKRIVVLGSTGSIGQSTLKIAEDYPERIEVVGLSAHARADLLLELTNKFRPRYVTLTDPAAFARFRERYDSSETEILPPETGIKTLAEDPDADVIINGIVGAAGLQASLYALRAGRRLALANKESMVIGGPLINEIIERTGAELIPVDSEHSAIWQCLMRGRASEVRKILLTGSGGPFRELPREKFVTITKEQALKHPNWDMGPKITVDSATMMNKALEVIEAVQLFGVPSSKVEVVIHPESIVHSMVEFIDSSIIAQLSAPDMKLPIGFAIFYPERIDADYAGVSLAEVGRLDFGKPDFDKFPLLEMAYRIADSESTSTAAFNAANEVAVEAFLNDSLKFVEIPDIVINTVEKHNPVKSPSYEEIIEADRQARQTAGKMMK